MSRGARGGGLGKTWGGGMGGGGGLYEDEASMRFLRDGTHDRSFYGPSSQVFRRPDTCCTMRIDCRYLTSLKL